MKKVFGVLAFLSFFYALGVVGGIEQDMIGLGAGFLHACISIGCFYLFCHLSGAFDPPDYTPPKKKSRPRKRNFRRRQAQKLNNQYSTSNLKKKEVSL